MAWTTLTAKWQLRCLVSLKWSVCENCRQPLAIRTMRKGNVIRWCPTYSTRVGCTHYVAAALYWNYYVIRDNQRVKPTKIWLKLNGKSFQYPSPTTAKMETSETTSAETEATQLRAEHNQSLLRTKLSPESKVSYVAYYTGLASIIKSTFNYINLHK